MNSSPYTKITFVGLGLVLIILSQFLFSLGYEFLMSQEPIDFAHWSLLIGSLLLFGLWFNLPENLTKTIGLYVMTIGIAGVIGMCTIDIILWAANDDFDLKGQIFQLISDNKSISFPFLIIGPTLFYMGVGISTYGLFTKFKWQVIVLNVGLLMIGIGHMIIDNRTIPVIGSIMLFIGLISILLNEKDTIPKTSGN